MSTFLFILFSGFICSKAAITNSELTDGSNRFGYDLSDELYTDSSTNIWTSPFCISSCFSLIYPGTASTTQTQIANVMYFPTTTPNPSDVTRQHFTLQSSIETTYNGESVGRTVASIIGIANKVYISNLITPKQTYITALTNGITQEQFIEQDFNFSSPAATTTINNWVSENTNGLIDSVVAKDRDISDWRLVALNAIYLNGTFASQFNKYMTSAQKFYSNGLRTTQVSDIHLMHQTDYFGYYSDGNYQFLKFPFSDLADLFVLFALPINSQLYSQRNGLITDVSFIQSAIDNLTRTYTAVALPKIAIAETYELNQQLIKMGMEYAFIDGQADFSNLADVPLVIDTVIHKTMIEMDENGLVAAAVTAIGVSITSVFIRPLPPNPILFKADHPFQMFIIDGNHDNIVLFMGQINDPGIPKGSDTPSYNEPTDSVWNDFNLYTVHTDAPTTGVGQGPPSANNLQTVMECVLPNTEKAGCAGRDLNIINPGQNFKVTCSEVGACTQSTLNFTYVNSMVGRIEQVSCSEQYSCYNAQIIIDSTQSPRNQYLDKFECFAPGACGGVIVKAVGGASINDVKCPRPEYCTGCEVKTCNWEGGELLCGTGKACFYY